MTPFNLTSPFLRSALFFLVTAAPVIFLWLFMVLPLQNYFAKQDAEFTIMQERLIRLKAIAHYQIKEQKPVKEASSTDRYLTGPDEGVVNANLQTRLKTLAQKSGAQLRFVQGLPSQTEDQLHLIGVRINLAGPIKAVQEVIHRIEAAQPYLFIKNALLKAPRRHRHQRQIRPIIEAQLDIYGAYRAESSK